MQEAFGIDAIAIVIAIHKKAISSPFNAFLNPGHQMVPIEVAVSGNEKTMIFALIYQIPRARSIRAQAVRQNPFMVMGLHEILIHLTPLIIRLLFLLLIKSQREK